MRPAPDPLVLVPAAAAGDRDAWDALVEGFGGLLWGICRAHRLGTSDAADVVQVVWLRLLEHLDTIQEPARLAGWLATTCRRECLAQQRRSRRTRPVGDERLLDLHAAPAAGADRDVLVDDRDAALWRAFEQLSDRCREILRVLLLGPRDAGSYRFAADALGMPVGSLGPTRRRCLERLRTLLGTEGINSPAADS